MTACIIARGRIIAHLNVTLFQAIEGLKMFEKKDKKPGAYCNLCKKMANVQSFKTMLADCNQESTESTGIVKGPATCKVTCSHLERQAPLMPLQWASS